MFDSYDNEENGKEKFSGWLKKPLAENSNADFEDVVNTKSILGELGFYQPHKEIGETKSEVSKYPNKNLFDAIEKYQEDKGLMVDRVMKPEGETEKSIISSIKNNTIKQLSDNTSNDDCNVGNFIKNVIKVNKEASVKSPFDTGNTATNFVLNKSVKPVGNFNKGFNLGQKAFILKEAYDETCNHKKRK